MSDDRIPIAADRFGHRLFAKALTGLSIPLGEREFGKPLRLLAQPVSLARRLVFGSAYKPLPEGPYLEKPRFYNVPVKVLSADSGGERAGAPPPIAEAARLGRHQLGCRRFRLAARRTAMIDLAQRHLRSLGLDPEQFHTESFTPPALARPVDDGRRYTVRFRRSEQTVEID